MQRDFQQLDWNQDVEDACRRIVRLAVYEDLRDQQDWTTVALTPEDRRGAADVAARADGVAAGMLALATVIDEMNLDVAYTPLVEDGRRIASGETLARLEGSVRDLLTSERILLNLLGRLTGIATLARQFVDAVADSSAKIYDTRKTTPGWRLLEKYAVRCGGACNHRIGLYDAVLIKDNHLAQMAAGEQQRVAPPAAIAAVREFLASVGGDSDLAQRMVEIEVDTLSQLEAVLPAGPDIVLLDNMSLDELRRAVAMRDAADPRVQLEASGGVRLETVGPIARTGVDRISVGGLTHSAVSLDIGLDWADADAGRTPS